MGKLGYKGLLLLGGMMMLGGAAQAQYLRSSYFWREQVPVYN